MKNSKTNNKPTGELRTKAVHIEFKHATATAISIAGTFNDWRPGVTSMISLGDGCRIHEPTIPRPTHLAG
jgi:hypothetical protein